MKSVFLATTALEEFWDTSKPIVFLSEGCRRYSRRAVWQDLEMRVAGNPWKDHEEIFRAHFRVNDQYEALLLQLAGALNGIHGVDHSHRYWRILIGPWLKSYLFAVYERYTELNGVLKQYPQLTTIGLSEKSFVVPRDSDEFNWLLTEDSYNLQIYTQILQFMGKDFPKRSADVVAKPAVAPARTSLFKMIGRRLFTGLSAMVEKTLHNKSFIVHKSSHFPAVETLKLFVKTRGNVLPNISGLMPLPHFNPDREKRERLRTMLAGQSAFERLLLVMLPHDIPQSVVEGYWAISERGKVDYPKKPKAILSANAWYYDDGFKHWAAAAMEGGALLLGTQHGGNYGSILCHWAENHETSVVDRYYTWGWGQSNGHGKIKPFSASKLMGRRRIKSHPDHGEILFVSTSAPRFSTSLALGNSSSFHEYLEWQARFIRGLPRCFAEKIRSRLHYVDYGWDMAQRMRDFFPDIQIEKWDVSFLESLGNCRLYVCDHLSTTFVEALVAGKPTILFWDPAVNVIRPEAKKYYEKLRSVGILYDTPEEAAEAVNQIYPKAALWWLDSGRQEVVREFCHQFARTSPTALKDWISEFKNVIAG